MKRLTTAILALTLIVMSTGAGNATAAPGASDRSGDMDLVLNFGALLDPPIEFSEITWIGTIEFDDVPYGIAFSDMSGRAHPVKEMPVVTHWSERWAVYELDTFVYEFTGPVLTTFEPGDPVLWGSDSGMTHWKNFTWVGNGRVEGAEYPFSEWLGNRVHNGGDFGVDFVGGTSWAEGILRVN